METINFLRALLAVRRLLTETQKLDESAVWYGHHDILFLVVKIKKIIYENVEFFHT